jgi:hypothetical protein
MLVSGSSEHIQYSIHVNSDVLGLGAMTEWRDIVKIVIELFQLQLRVIPEVLVTQVMYVSKAIRSVLTPNRCRAHVFEGSIWDASREFECWAEFAKGVGNYATR